jgi:hypothetical protein
VRNYRKYIIIIFCLAALLISVSGCFRISTDELYSLPQASTEYLKLQEQINTVLATGAEYAPPTSGPNRQSVQLKDIDGDGKNEAIAFFKTSGDEPLKIYIMKQTGGTYQTADVIEGDGTAIESIRYEDMDGDGVSELIVGWQMSAVLLHMSIYSIKDNQHITLADANFTDLVVYDIDGDGYNDVVALRLPSAELPGEASMFSLKSEGVMSSCKVPLSKGLESIDRVITGKLSFGAPAIFVEGKYSGGDVITDILSWKTTGLANISAGANGISESTLRAYAIYSTDINKDGIIETPSAKLLESASETKYYVNEWYAFDRDGGKAKVFTTYHDFNDGWYMILPDDWTDKITVRREDTVTGERTLIFSYLSEADGTGKEAPPVDFLKIYALSGDNKDDRAKITGRFKLLEQGDIIYAAEILTTDVNITVNKTMIIDNFKLLYTDWATGVM